MDTELFNDLVQSIKEAKEISKGVRPASRRFVIQTPDIKGTREQAGLTQAELADMMHVSVKTLQNWEQGRRHPTGAAAALLKIVIAEPEMALRALNR